ncbi:MAG: hypothetical protein SV760_10125, partial [Halobacteria archaeon]|nr:hypothetical protein [Halobacteria archaeon]
ALLHSGGSNPASPATAVFVIAGLVGVAAFYFGYLTYTRGGREAETRLWLYGLVATGVLGLYAAYVTFSRIGALPEVVGSEAVAVLLVALFLMLMFREGAEFFE